MTSHCAHSTASDSTLKLATSSIYHTPISTGAGFLIIILVLLYPHTIGIHTHW